MNHQAIERQVVSDETIKEEMVSGNGEENKGLIFNIQRFSLHDGPGIRTVVFMKGCPLRCRWCSNPESINRCHDIWVFNIKCIKCGRCQNVCSPGAIANTEEGISIARSKCNLCFKCIECCPTKAIESVGSYLTVREVVNEVEKDRLFYKDSGGGVTLSGGEPLFQPGFAWALLKECKKRKLNTVLETSGYVPGETIEQILEHVDLVLYDIKSLVGAKHKQYTGVNNTLILANVKKVTTRAKTWLRIPVVTGVNDSESDIESLSEFASALRIEKISLLPLHHWGQAKYGRLGITYPFEGIAVPDEALIHKYKEILESRGLTVTIGG